jgi:hypothetical protein
LGGDNLKFVPDMFQSKIPKICVTNTAGALVLFQVTNDLHYRDCLSQFFLGSLGLSGICG